MGGVVVTVVVVFMFLFLVFLADLCKILEVGKTNWCRSLTQIKREKLRHPQEVDAL